MNIDRKWLSRVASEEGFVRDTLEKVYEIRRLSKIVKIKVEAFVG
jgi:hypothetical protein